MAHITGIRELRGLVEVSLDGVVWLRVRKKHFGLRPLEDGAEIEPEAYIDSLAAAQAADCYEAALCMLDVAAQTRNDLAKKLIRKGFVAPVAESTADRLVANGLIDDRRYAERIAQSQLHKPVGAYAVRRKLRAKQLSEEDVEAVMEGFDEAQQSAACAEAAAKLWRKYAALPGLEGRVRLSQALARRGFSWDAIRNVTEKICSGCTDDDDFYED